MQMTGDAGLRVRLPVTAGPHVVGVSFTRELWEPEGLPQPLQRGRVITNDQIYMDYASVGAVRIGGPFDETGLADTPSRQAIFSCEPATLSDAAADAGELSCATEILSRLARRAYRRPVTDGDVASLLEFFEAGRTDGGSFDTGVQYALERMLVDPDFLLRVYRDPPPSATDDVYPLSDLEVASRLSFFLWSSIPDEELLSAWRKKGNSTTAADGLEALRSLAGCWLIRRAVDALINNFVATVASSYGNVERGGSRIRSRYRGLTTRTLLLRLSNARPSSSCRQHLIRDDRSVSWT